MLTVVPFAEDCEGVSQRQFMSPRFTEQLHFLRGHRAVSLDRNTTVEEHPPNTGQNTTQGQQSMHIVE